MNRAKILILNDDDIVAELQKRLFLAHRPKNGQLLIFSHHKSAKAALAAGAWGFHLILADPSASEGIRGLQIKNPDADIYAVTSMPKSAVGDGSPLEIPVKGVVRWASEGKFTHFVKNWFWDQAIFSATG